MGELKIEEGITTRKVGGRDVVASYGNDEGAREAYKSGAMLVDRSHWGLIRLAGSTRHAFLHNQTTADFNRARAGESVEAVVLTSTARIVDWVRALVTEDAMWLVTSPERREILLNWFPRFIFFNDDVRIVDESDNYAIFSLLGPESGTLLRDLGASDVMGLEPGHHTLVTLADVEGVRVAVGGGLLGEGYTLIVPVEGAEALWSALRAAGAEPAGEDVWEALRVEQGRPAADRELTEDHNPLEAGLWEAVSFTKGCYIGQEIVARLDTYQKLKQQLWGLRLSDLVQPGAPVLVEGSEVGHVTSVAKTPEGPFALAYIRTKAGGEGLEVQVDGVKGTVVDLPMVTRGRRDI
ncbi:MAG: folate-binding protein [Chloroflexota bacterium]|nr:folate-binding protein [Chloroflexota bacterium]